MSIYTDVIVKLNLNELVWERSRAIDIALTDSQREEVASELRTRMSFDSLFEQTDMMIWEITDSTEHLPHYGEIQPEPGREAELNRREKAMKEFEMVDLVAPAWTIKVPRRREQ
tara:strand:+ start:306 stop:647 length:342 start_codon:yes stop_codon:yes gene_type:complete